jgi:hypothetical protein
MHRLELQALAELRVEEARTLLQAHHPRGAYYLAGYAIELALKAIIAKRFEEHSVPDPKLVSDFFGKKGHDFENLVSLALIKDKFTLELKRNIFFRANWAIIKNWSTESRYSLFLGVENTVQESSLDFGVQETLDLFLFQGANSLLNAVTDKKDGIFPWLKIFW